MTAGEYTLGEAMEAAMSAIKARGGMVTIDTTGNVSMRTGPGQARYEFEIISPGDALRWIEHIAAKSWCTKTHLEVFASLAASHFGVRYR